MSLLNVDEILHGEARRSTFMQSDSDAEDQQDPEGPATGVVFSSDSEDENDRQGSFAYTHLTHV